MEAISASLLAAVPVGKVEPLGASDHADLKRTRNAYRPIRRAARTATFSSCTTLVIGLFAMLSAVLSPDVAGIATAAALLAIGAVEWVGSRRLLRADLSAARLLMLNQLAFVVLITAYCIFQMASFSMEKIKNDALPPEVREQLAPMPQIATEIDQNLQTWAPLGYFGLYGSLWVVGLACQGGLARYYSTRTKYLRTFHQTTPPWARQLLQTLSN